MTPHNSAKKEQIVKKVIMVGDPLRSKFIVENYFDDYEIVSGVRGNNVYTGHYKGAELTVMASGMGMPSMGIYAYELFNFYDVDIIIRVGTAGAYNQKLNLFDIVLAEKTYSETNFALTLANEKTNIVYPTKDLNEKILKQASNLNKNIHLCDIASTDSFYMDDLNKYFERMPENIKPEAAEMESYALFYLAKKFNKQAACVLTISDIIGTNIETTPEEREKGLREAIELTLETMVNLEN